MCLISAHHHKIRINTSYMQRATHPGMVAGEVGHAVNYHVPAVIDTTTFAPAGIEMTVSPIRSARTALSEAHQGQTPDGVKKSPPTVRPATFGLTK